MKIGVLASIGGTIDAFFPPIISRWEELGHEVVSAASTEARSVERHTIINSITRAPSLKNINAPRDLKAWIREEGIDVLITNTATASFLARVLKMPVPVVYFCHGLHWNDKNGLSTWSWQILERVALRNTDAVVVINHDDQEWFLSQKFNSSMRRLAMGVGVPLETFRRSTRPQADGKIQLLWVGEFSERKRPWFAVDVVQELKSLGMDVHLTMCGGGHLSGKTQAQIDNFGLNNSIDLVGRSSDIAEKLANSHMLLMTSAWEGLPRVGLEALAVGRPVFAFDVKGTRSLPNVVLSIDEDPVALAKAIEKHFKEDFKSCRLIEPSELHPNRAADEIASLMKEIL